MHSSSDGILAVSHRGEVLFANQRFMEMWNIPPDVMASRDDFRLIQYALDQLSAPQGFLHKVKELYHSMEESFDTLIFKDGRAFERLSRPLMQKKKLFGRVWSFRDVTKQKQAEETLRESEERYRSLFDRMMDGVYRSTHAGRFVDVNPAMVKMFGYASKQEMLDIDIKKELYFAPEERGSHVLDTGQEEVDIYHLRRKDGSEIWVEDHGYYVHDQQGNVLYHEGMLRDITSRKQTEDALIASEAELRALFTSMQDAVLIIDQEGVYRKIVSSIPELLIQPPEELLGKSLKDVFPADEAEKFITAIKQVLDTRKSAQIEYQLLIGGQTVWFQTTISPLDAGNTLWVAHDITNRREAERALRAAEADYRSIFENATAGIYQSTPDGHFLSVNPAMALMFGYDSPQEMLTSVNNIEKQFYVDPNDRQEFQRLLLKQGEVRDFSSLYRHRDGRQVWVQENARAVTDENGNILHYEGFLTDITERKRIEQAVRESEALYRQAIEVAGGVPYRQKYMKTPKGERIDYEFIGEGIRQITGYGPEEFNGAVWDSMVLEVHPIEELAGYTLEEAVRKVRNGEFPIWKCDFKIRTRRGDIRWVFEAAVELRDVNGISYGSIGIYLDMTHRKQAEEELRHAKDALEAANLELQQSLEREKLLASTDSLTGVCNRRNFFNIATREFQAAIRYKHALTFLMFDLDGFKAVNDTLGHATGDILLKQIAQAAVEQVRVSDVVARYGGDEFIVILPHADAEQTLPIAERLHQRIASLGMEVENGPFAITISIGIAEIRQEPVDEEVDLVIQRADEALYEAKRGGRNQIVIFGRGKEDGQS